jgi:hypothetical protein
VDVLVLPSDWAFRIAAIDGHPIITVPLGFYPAGTPTSKTLRGLVSRGVNFPFGISFISRKFSEEKLLAYAYAFEQASMAISLVKPHMLPTTQVYRCVYTYLYICFNPYRCMYICLCMYINISVFMYIHIHINIDCAFPYRYPYTHTDHSPLHWRCDKNGCHY